MPAATMDGATRRQRWARVALAGMLLPAALASHGHAQETGVPAGQETPAEPHTPQPGGTEPSATHPADADGTADAVANFDTIRVVGKRPEWVDPFAFRPLFDPDANTFQRHWNEPPSVEEVSLSGGYIMLGINYGLLKAAEAVTRLPGWKDQVQPASARPPPLDAEQAERAARLRAAQNP